MPADFTTQLFTLRTGDTGRPLEMILEDPDSGEPQDLTDCTVEFVMIHATAGTTRTRAATIVEPAENGRVRHDFVADDVEEAGQLNCRWVVTTEDGDPITFPSEDHVIVFLTD